MLIKKSNDSSIRLRITEKIESLLLVTEGTTMTNGVYDSQLRVSAHIEKKGKNIELYNNIKITDLLALTNHADEVAHVRMMKSEGKYKELYKIPLMANGNLAMKDGEALVVVIDNPRPVELAIYGLEDLENSNYAFNIEEKVILAGERVKEFDTRGYDRLVLPNLLNNTHIKEVSFYVYNEDGGITEVKKTLDELLFEINTQQESFPFRFANQIDFEKNVIALPFIVSVKFHLNDTVKESTTLLFQRLVEVDRYEQSIPTPVNSDCMTCSSPSYSNPVKQAPIRTLTPPSDKFLGLQNFTPIDLNNIKLSKEVGRINLNNLNDFKLR